MPIQRYNPGFRTDDESCAFIASVVPHPDGPLVKWEDVEPLLKESASVLKKLSDTYPSTDDWWCPNCGETECSFEGCCTKCGMHIETVDTEVLMTQVRAALARLGEFI